MAQAHKDRLLYREIGVALAVLSLWFLSLLAPMHQAAGLLREMAQAGVDTTGAWTICVTQTEGSDPDGMPQICPAHGIGKSEIALPPPGLELAPHRRLLFTVSTPRDRAVARPLVGWLAQEPRGPPHLIA